MTFIDMFCGMGTVRMGFEKAGHECVYSVEWDMLNGSWWAYMDHDCNEIDGGDAVTHWMPLPEPPKGE